MVTVRSKKISEGLYQNEGYIEEGEASSLSTDMAHGSNYIELPSGDWYFLDKKTDSWDVLLNIKINVGG